MSKIYTVNKTIGGKEYTAQFNGISAYYEAVDSMYIDGSQNMSSAKMAKYVLENVIVVPKGLTLDEFDDINEANEVISFGREVMEGKFRDKPNQSPAKAKDKQ